MLAASEGASNRFSLTGVTHTLCSHRVMQGLGRVTAPLEPWDALVCTSRSALQVVQQAMACTNAWNDVSATLPIPQGPQLPLIPLGLDPEPFNWQGRFASRQEQRLHARQQLGLSPSARVVLFLGRLSFHSKAHPLALYRALDRLSATHELVLLECGHIFNADISAAYDQLHQRYPHLTLRRIGGLTAATEDDKKLALAAADLFCSPADNLQETFGLSVLVAMASSLPVVASVWIGYRELVIHGRTGWLVPCRDLLPGKLADALIVAAAWVCRTDSTVGLRSLGKVLDHAALERVWASSGRSRTLRFHGRSGQDANDTFAWRVVSEQYRDLWRDLASAGHQRIEIPIPGRWLMPHACLPATPEHHHLQAPGGWIKRAAIQACSPT